MGHMCEALVEPEVLMGACDLQERAAEIMGQA